MYDENSKFKNSIFRFKIIITLFSLITATCFMSAVAISLSSTADATDGKIKLPVLMYHLVIDDDSYTSEFVITPTMFREDMEYIRSQGYNTVVMQDIINYVKYDHALPDNPIMITLDDGYYNNYLNVYPILQELSMRAVISVIGAETDKYSAPDAPVSEYYSHCTWQQLQEMSDSGVIELQNHSYDMHHIENGIIGIDRLPNETSPDYRIRIFSDLSKMQERFETELSQAPTTFTYPFGSADKEGQAVIEEVGFTASLGTSGVTYYVSDDISCLQLIPRYNRTNEISAEDILKNA